MLITNSDIQDDFSTKTQTISSAPIAYYCSNVSALADKKVYSSLVSTLGDVVEKKYKQNVVKCAGVIIDTTSQFAEPAGFELLKNAVEAFKGIDLIECSKYNCRYWA